MLLCFKLKSMKKIATGIVLGLLISLSTAAQKEAGKKNIEKLCGCFEVEFKYAETFAPNPEYKFHEREKISAGVELALPIEVTDTKISIQHLLIVGDNMIVKHWREDWVYQPETTWVYEGDKRWVKKSIPAATVAGKWLQSVWEVSDAPRYQGSSEWLQTDGHSFWQNTTDAPLPRREYSARNDYNILRRTNRIILTENGYRHEQDNQKIIRANGKDQLLVEEKGLNSYTRTAEKDCAAGKLYWEKNKEYWARVRSVWAQWVATHNSLELKDQVDGKVLHQYLNDLEKQYAANKIKADAIDETLRATLNKFASVPNAVVKKN